LTEAIHIRDRFVINAGVVLHLPGGEHAADSNDVVVVILESTEHFDGASDLRISLLERGPVFISDKQRPTST
jgi:hypothetical protein